MQTPILAEVTHALQFFSAVVSIIGQERLEEPAARRNVEVARRVVSQLQRMTMAAISVLIGVLIIVIVGAICFWAIDRFATDGRLANLLKLLVVLVCLGAIVQRLLTLTY